MSFLSVRRVEKSFGSVRVLRSVNLEVARGELLALLGPSGSGKSTLLRIIAGFETAENGSLLLDGAEFTQVPPQRRGFGMVFQSYALFPHLSVFDNVAFGLKASRGRLDQSAVRERVVEMLELVQLENLADRGIDQISGGQQQRVALARALAPRPKLLLLDEPLSNLDPSLRDQTRQQLRSVLRSVGITAILVTHEQEEAFELGDRVAVLDQGRIEQVATPLELYREPSTEFVARFIGRANVLEAELVEASQSEPDQGRRDPGSTGQAGADQGSTDQASTGQSKAGRTGSARVGVKIGGWNGHLSVPAAAVTNADPSRDASGDVRVWLRPEHLSLALREDVEQQPGDQRAHCFGRVRSCRLLGPYALVQVELEEPAAGLLEVASRDPIEHGARVMVVVDDAESSRLIRARP